MRSPVRLRPKRVEDGLWDSNQRLSGTAAQRHNGDGGGESQSKRQELTFEFCSALAEVMQLSTDALAEVISSARVGNRLFQPVLRFRSVDFGQRQPLL